MTIRLGFACSWGRHPASTWSGTPWALRQALSAQAQVVDLGVSIPIAQRALLKGLYWRRRRGTWVSTWRHSKAFDLVCEREIRRNLRSSPCDAVLEIHDLAPLAVPFFVLQDLSFDVLLRYYDHVNGGPMQLPWLTYDLICRRRERQHDFFDRCSGVITLSHWLARTLVEWSGLPPAKVHPIHPGVSVSTCDQPEGERHPVDDGDRRRRRMLFVGKDFFRKGGDLVVQALKVLRAEHDPSMTLTVAGPPRWPLPGGVPAGVTFLGSVPPAQVASLYRTHDLFVMPSRFEAFGLVFLEALAAGLPCIGRNDFAMPELISPGRNGALVDGEDPQELARTIVETIDDDALFEQSRRDGAEVARRFSWERTATETLRVMSASS
jgi:glycosyltransferase involved in cell wall biosynthesis